MNRLLCSLFALALVLAACGDDDASVEAGADGDAVSDGDTDADLEPNADGGDQPVDPDAPINFGGYPVGELAFEVTNPDGSTMTYTVSCLGDTATLFGDWDTSGDGLGGTAADSMCNRLADAAVQDLLVNGFPDDLVCTDQFGSEHVATVTGTLDGAAVSIELDRFDGCGIDSWDVLLADLLPAVE